MSPECIDPMYRESFENMASVSPEEIALFYTQEPGLLGEARLHLKSCPSCRAEFTWLPSILGEVQNMLVATAAKTLVEQFNSFAAEEFSDAADKVSRLLEAGRNVQFTLGFVLDQFAMFTVADESDRERTPLANCSEFLSSFAPEVQEFVATSIMTEELLGNATVRYRLEHEELLNLLDVIQNERLYAREAVEGTGISSVVFLTVIELAARSCIFPAKGKQLSSVQIVSASPILMAAMQRMKDELLSSIGHDIDSLKAGQMETLRLVDHNSTRAMHYEPYIRDCVGHDLYEHLAEPTRRALCVGEYLLNLITEPDCYAAPTLSFCEAYEKELTVRVYWPVIQLFRESGVLTYNANGFATRPLLVSGQVLRSTFTLGTLAWYLKNAAELRSHVSRLGFTVDAIAADAHWVSTIRNKAAHESAVPKTLVVDLKERMFTSDGLIRHLHPSAGAATGR